MANNMGVTNKNVRLKYAHLHDSIGHSQFAPKGDCITIPLHVHFAPLVLPYRAGLTSTRTEFMMVSWSIMALFLLLRMVPRKTGFVSCPGQTLSFRAYCSFTLLMTCR